MALTLSKDQQELLGDPAKVRAMTAWATNKPNSVAVPDLLKELGYKDAEDLALAILRGHAPDRLVIRLINLYWARKR